MTAIAIIVPTTGRDSLQATLESLAPQVQDGDRVLVMCDEPTRYDRAQRFVDEAREESLGRWCCYPTIERKGMYGHPQRNRALELLNDLENRPEWCWSVDDDDVATFGALDFIRQACESGESRWYVFGMVGGPGSHFDGLVVPTKGPVVELGNVGTPMLVWPTHCDSAFGCDELRGQPAGYFGDAQMAKCLVGEFGQPAWRPEIVCEIRPVSVDG